MALVLAPGSSFGNPLVLAPGSSFGNPLVLDNDSDSDSDSDFDYAFVPVPAFSNSLETAIVVDAPENDAPAVFHPLGSSIVIKDDDQEYDSATVIQAWCSRCDVMLPPGQLCFH